MPITFDCEGCGKFYTVPDELAGRTARCKQCSTSMVIPKPAAKRSAIQEGGVRARPVPPRGPTATTKKSRPSAPAPDEEEELVGAEVIEDDEPAPLRPRKARADRPAPKKTGEEIVAAEVIEDDEPAPAAPKKKNPAPADEADPFAFTEEESARKARRPAPRLEAGADDEEEESPPPKSRKRAAPVEAEDEEETPPPPRKRRKKVRKSSALVWVIGGLAVGLLLLSVAGAAVYFLFMGSSGSVDDDARFFPDNCAVVASVRMKDLCDSTAFKEVEQIAPGSNRMRPEFETEFGMPPEAIRQLVIAFAVQDKDAPVMILHANRDVTADAFKAKLRGNFDQLAVGSYTIYQNPSKAFCLIDSRTAVLAPPAVLQAILKRDKKAVLPAGLQEGLQSVSLSRTAVIVADLKATRKPGSGGLMDIPLADKFMDPVEVLAIQVDVGSDVNLDATAICRDAAAADDARKLIEGGLVAAKSQPGLPAELAEILGAVKVSTSGKKLTGNLRFKPSRLTKGFLPGQPNPRPKK
jgi:hypothetical protein